MDAMRQFRDEHAWLRREMDGIEVFLSAEGLDRPDELRERLRALWIFLLRHERLEESWMSGGWMTPPGKLSDVERETAHRDHGNIIAVLDSLGRLLLRFDGPSRGGPIPAEDRQSVRSTVDGLFRFVREHLDREDRGILEGSKAREVAALKDKAVEGGRHENTAGH